MYLAYKKEYLNKILFIFLLTIFIIMCLISPCFATEIPSIDVVYNGETYTLTDYPEAMQDFDYLAIFPQSLNSSTGEYFEYVLWGFEYVDIIGRKTMKGTRTVFALDGSQAGRGWSTPYTASNFVAFKADSIPPVWINFDMLDQEGNVVFAETDLTNYPSFINTDLATGKFDILKIDMGDFNTNDDKVIFNIYNNYDMGDGVYSDYKYKSFMLDSQSSYIYVANLNVYYNIPRDKLGIDLSNGKRYSFELTSIDGQTVYDRETFEISGLTSDEEEQNKEDEMGQKLDEQTDAIKENTETNKGIWETIKDILSYINPFSENFFVYKLIELLVEAIKSLFIPSDDFFSTYFTELKEWFSDRLGFLFYPFELLIDILNEILNIDFSHPMFNIPDIVEPFSNKKLISATTFNLNDLLNNSVWNTVHNVYLVCVDAFIVFGLVALFRRKYEEVTTK